jgi:murein DD-endopeptidase MepM/ murein hydrolase activator NlpD
VEASTRKQRLAGGLARQVLLPTIFVGTAILCMLLAIALTFTQRAKMSNALSPQERSQIAVKQLSADLEGRITPADIRRARKPLSERKRLLAAHPYYSLYTIAKQRFGVSLFLLAAAHYQETGFGKAPHTLAGNQSWLRYRTAAATANVVRPAHYPHRSSTHPSVKDDFDVVMALAAQLKANHAQQSLGASATKALAKRYGSTPQGQIATAMVIERAKAWRLLGTLPLPGRGELATPVKGVVGGCGYFGCPRPGHLHNGVDFLAPQGTPIHAVDAGTIALVQGISQSGGYGNFVCIQHRPHLASCYAHMSAYAAGVHLGARVKRGQVIGLVGTTGSSTAPHLHFEIRRGPAACQSCAVDPLPLLSGDVPDAVLPKMVGSVPVSTTIRAASAGVSVPVSAAARATAPVVAVPSPGDLSDVQETTAVDPGAPVAGTPLRKRVAANPTETGGARPVAPAPAPAQATAPAANAPAPAAPGPSPTAPATTGPDVDTGTGGATPDVSAPAAAPPP